MKKKIFSIICIFFAIYLLGVFSGAKKIFPYWQVKKVYEQIFKKNHISNLKKFNKCSISEIFELPSNFSVIVGHAYGSPDNSLLSDNIGENISKFLSQNKKNISSIIFTGDVFSVPSSKKWNNLFNNFKSNKIYIAPGNHDILRPDSREIFFSNKFIVQPFPYNIFIEKYFILIDDSISSKWEVSSALVKKVNSYNNDMIVARHNIPIVELLPFTNNSSPKKITLPNVEQFIKKFSKEKKITWVIGDGGAFAHSPRLSCLQIQNHRFIINGLGEVENDTILILYEGKIFKYIIGK